MVGWSRGTDPASLRLARSARQRRRRRGSAHASASPRSARDIAAAVGEALRYPLSGPPLADLVTPGGRVTIVVEPPCLPLPGATIDPRQEAVAAVIDELERLGMPAERHTILIAGGLERRAGRRELESVLRPDAGARLPGHGRRPRRDELRAASRSTLGRERPRHDPPRTARGRPRRLRDGSGDLRARRRLRAARVPAGPSTIASAAPAPSLLAPSLSPTGVLAGTASRRRSHARRAVIGVSIVLDHPRLTGSYRGYPSSPQALDALARSPLRRVLNVLPGSAARARPAAGRARARRDGVLAGPPAVAHAEALLRGISLRGTHARRSARHDRRAAAVEVGSTSRGSR